VISQDGQIDASVLIAEEDVGLMIATLGDMMGASGDYETSETSHRRDSAATALHLSPNSGIT